jgi:hypothetical protein
MVGILNANAVIAEPTTTGIFDVQMVLFVLLTFGAK